MFAVESRLSKRAVVTILVTLFGGNKESFKRRDEASTKHLNSHSEEKL